MSPVKKAFRYIYYPLLLIVSVALFFIFKERFSEKELPLLTALIAIGNIIVIHISERLLPYRKEWNISQGDFFSDLIFTNLILPILSTSAQIILVYLFVNGSSDFVQEHLHTLWPQQWPLLAQLALALIITELFFYWIHRLAHTFTILWRFHAIHHVVKRIYWNNSGRFHPVDLFLNWIIYFAPLFILGVPSELVALFLLVNAVTGLLEHANVDFEMSVLNRIFNTAQLHRWHHSVVPEISSQNFGKVLSVWDSVFGTWYNPKDQHVAEIGVEGEAIPSSSWGQMAYPLKELARSRKK